MKRDLKRNAIALGKRMGIVADDEETNTPQPTPTTRPTTIYTPTTIFSFALLGLRV